MSEPTFLVEWQDSESNEVSDGCHSIEYGTIADLLSILGAALDSNAWDVRITQNDAEEVAGAA